MAGGIHAHVECRATERGQTTLGIGIEVRTIIVLKQAAAASTKAPKKRSEQRIQSSRNCLQLMQSSDYDRGGSSGIRRCH
eukprot:3808612-Amphidinium_carterae.1